MINYLTRLIETPTIDDLWALHLERISDYGFDRMIYGFTHVWDESRFGDPDDIMILSNHPTDYTQSYIYDGHYSRAPIAFWALLNPGPVSWSKAREHQEKVGLSQAEVEVLELNKKHGVTAGYTISFASNHSREKAALVMTAKEGTSQEEVDEIWAKNGREIHSLSTLFHLKARTMPHKYRRSPLTKRQREVLEWVGDGKTAQDIGTILNLTVATVEKHLRLAREALDVDTTTQAVLKASFQKQIFIVDT